MSSLLKDLGIDRLSLDDRIRLVEEIWDDIAATVESGSVPESHKELLDRRIATHEADPRSGSSWDEVKARLRVEIGE